MSVFNAYMALSGAVDADLLRDERLSHRTTYRIGGPAALFATVNSYSSLVRTLSVLRREGVEWVILGRGSNVLVSDEGYDGCVIKLGREFSRITFSEDGCVTAGAGANLSKLVSETLSHGLSGLEFCVGIPGSVGGAVSMDAGTRHEWVGPRVQSLVALRPGGGMCRYAGPDIEWGYRWSSIPADEIILEVTLALTPAAKAGIAEEMEHRLARRRATQPMGRPSCGSVFRDPGDASAGRLIESCGLKGYAVGGAQVSDQHANFIVNMGGAKASDVLAVMGHVHDVVAQNHGVDLRPEVKCLGFRG